MSLLSRHLTNLSVAKKLTAGFGFMILLTLLVTLIAIYSLDGLIERGQKQIQLSQVDQLAKEIYSTQLLYEQDASDEQAERLRELIGQTRQGLQALQPRFSASDDQRDIAAGLQHIDRLAQGLPPLQAARLGREQSRALMVSSAGEALANLQQLEQQIYAALAENPAEQLLHQQNQALGDLVKRVLESRYLVRGFVFQHTDASAQLAFDGLDKTLAQAARLRELLPAEQLPYLDNLSTSLQSYRSAIDAFRLGLEKTAQASQNLHQQIDGLRQLNKQLLGNQQRKAEQETQQALRQAQLIALVSILLGILSAWLITRQITLPLRQTLQLAQRISAGDLSGSLDSQRRDELGQLQQNMQAMRQSLRELIGSIGSSATQIATAAEELSAVTEQTSAGANDQRMETDQVATAINEMTATVQDVARNAVEASQATSQADQQARQGDRVVGEAISQIERMAAQVTLSTDAMERLRQDSEAIGSVLDVIKSVAQQTNLLALNAAIEAARAGEAGRGFAVVADEVRGLAQRTQQSTEEIEKLIANLQNGAQSATQLMKDNQQLSLHTVELTRRAGVALEDISQTVSQIQGMNEQIATAAEQQSAVAEEINRSVLNVRDISIQTATASDQTAAASNELARLGNALQQQIGRFRL